MPIYPDDIRTRKAVEPGQFANSGGRIHPADYVENQEVGGLLPKLTEVDHAVGRFDATKAYLSIETAGTDQGDDCYTYIDNVLADSNIDVLLVRPVAAGVRSGHTDVRADLRTYAESYQIKGGRAPWHLRGIHTAGMRTLVLWSRESARLPDVGQTLYLGANEGTGGEYGQYVQISGYTHEMQWFQDSGTENEYERRIIYVDITAALGFQFDGPEVTKIDPSSPAVLVRETVVADSGHYYGMSRLAVAADEGASGVQVASVYGQVVPAARGELAMAAVPAITAGSQTLTSGGQSFTVTGPVHTQRQQVTADNRRNLWTRTLLPIPATGGAVVAHVRILDRWYRVVEGETSTIGSLTCNRASGGALLSLSALPDADTWILWEFPAAIHFTDRAGAAAIVDPILISFDLPSEPDANTLSLSWPSGASTITATEGSNGVISGTGVTGFRIGTKIGLYLTGLPNGNASIAYAYAPITRQTETLTPAFTGAYATVTLSNPARPGSLTLEWRVKQQTTRESKYKFKKSWGPYAGLALPNLPNFVAWEGDSATSENDQVTHQISDDGAGHIGTDGTFNDETGVAYFLALHAYSANSYTTYTYANAMGEESETGDWAASELTESMDGLVVARYALAEAIPGAEVTGEIDVPDLKIHLLRGVQDFVVPGTVRFNLGTVAYSDRDGTGGKLYWNDGTEVGTIDYSARIATLSNWTGGTPTVTVTSMLSTFGNYLGKQIAFRTSAAPLASASLSISATDASGTLVTGDGDTDGIISGAGLDDTETNIVEYANGVVVLTFDEPVYPGTLKYSATAFQIIPLDPAVIGIDPVRLPPDGRVPKFRAGDMAVVFEDAVVSLPNPAVAGATYDLGHEGLAFASLEDGAGEQTYTCPGNLQPGAVIQVPKNSRTGPLEYLVLEDARARPVAGALYTPDLAAWTATLPAPFSADGYEEPFVARFLPLVLSTDYEVDRDTGELTMADPLVLTGYTQPLKARVRWHHLSLITEAQTTGLITLQVPLPADFSTAAGIASCLLHGDLGARVANKFVQHSDVGTWADYQQGSAPTSGANYDWIGYPVVVSNRGAIRERWRLKKRSDGSWDVIGETLGVIAVWAGTATLNAKRSSSQAYPYFTFYHEGLGSGWATGNLIQFETFAAQGPFWVVRSVMPGRAVSATDSLRLRHRVGAD